MYLIDKLLGIYSMVLVAYAMLSWFHIDRNNPVSKALERVTEPVLDPIRRNIPPVGNLDVSVLLALLLIYFLRGFLRFY